MNIGFDVIIYMREFDSIRYKQIRAGIDIAHVASNYGICMFIGLISIGILLITFFLLAPPFINSTRSLSYLIGRGNITLNQIDTVISYHNGVFDNLETKINRTLTNADILLDEALVDIHKASQVLDQMALIIQYIENHLPFFPHNSSCIQKA